MVYEERKVTVDPGFRTKLLQCADFELGSYMIGKRTHPVSEVFARFDRQEGSGYFRDKTHTSSDDGNTFVNRSLLRV